MQRVTTRRAALTLVALFIGLSVFLPLRGALASGSNCNFADRIHDIDRGVGGDGPWSWHPTRTGKVTMKLDSLSKEKGPVTFYTKDGRVVSGYLVGVGDGPDGVVTMSTSNNIEHAQQWSRFRVSEIDPDMIHAGEPMPGLEGIKKGDICTIESSASGNTYEGTFAGVTTQGDIKLIPKNRAYGLPEILDRKNIKAINGKPLLKEARAPHGHAPPNGYSPGFGTPAGGIPREAAPAYARLEFLGHKQVTLYAMDGKSFTGYVARNADGSVAIGSDGRVILKLTPDSGGAAQNIHGQWVDLTQIHAPLIHSGPPIPGLEGWPAGKMSTLTTQGWTHEGVITQIDEKYVTILPKEGGGPRQMAIDQLETINGKPVRQAPGGQAGPQGAGPRPDAHEEPPHTEPPPAQQRPPRGPASPAEQAYSKISFKKAAAQQKEVTFYTRNGDQFHGKIQVDPQTGELAGGPGKVIVYTESRTGRTITEVVNLADVDGGAIHFGKPIPGVADAIKSGKVVEFESYSRTYRGRITGLTEDGDIEYNPEGTTEIGRLSIEKLKKVNGKSIEEYNQARAKGPNAGAGGQGAGGGGQDGGNAGRNNHGGGAAGGGGNPPPKPATPIESKYGFDEWRNTQAGRDAKAKVKFVVNYQDQIDQMKKIWARQIIGVSEDANTDQIRKRFRSLMAELHPDRNPDPRATDRAKYVSEAYNLLK